MNDPHVVSLLYRVDHSKSVDYSKAELLVRDEPAFRLEVKDNQARFELKDHYATEEDARNAIEDYIHGWEFDTCLENGPDYFRLKFESAQIEDRKPISGVTNYRAIITTEILTISDTITVGVPNYPTPPSGVNFCDTDVQKMYQRFMDYRQSKEPLASMAYFCLTCLENTTGQHKKPSQSGCSKISNRQSSA